VFLFTLAGGVLVLRRRTRRRSTAQVSTPRCCDAPALRYDSFGPANPGFRLLRNGGTGFAAAGRAIIGWLLADRVFEHSLCRQSDAVALTAIGGPERVTIAGWLARGRRFASRPSPSSASSLTPPFRRSGPAGGGVALPRRPSVRLHRHAVRGTSCTSSRHAYVFRRFVVARRPDREPRSRVSSKSSPEPRR